MDAVETMFYVGREKPWHGLGVSIPDYVTSEDAIVAAGLDWRVESKQMFLADGTSIPDAYANVRSTDNRVLGVVGNRYQIVQNVDAFSFTDALLGEGVKYETAGSLFNGRVIWLLAKLPEKYKILGDEVTPYVVFTNTHDGTGSVKVAMTPVRIVCANTLNAGLKQAKRTWSARHTGNINDKMQDAMNTLQLADAYMKATQNLFEDLYKVKTTDAQVVQLVNNIVPIKADMTDRQANNVLAIRSDIMARYNFAPDLKDREKTGARLIQAIADTTSHMNPLRQTKNYAENKLKATIDGNALLDTAIATVLSVA